MINFLDALTKSCIGSAELFFVLLLQHMQLQDQLRNSLFEILQIAGEINFPLI